MAADRAGAGPRDQQLARADQVDRREPAQRSPSAPPRPADWEQDLRGGLGIIEARSEALARFMGAYARLARLPPPQLGAGRGRAPGCAAWPRSRRGSTVRVERRAAGRRHGRRRSARPAAHQPRAQRRRRVARDRRRACGSAGAPSAAWSRSTVDDDGPGLPDPGEPLRAVLHHEGRRVGHRPRAVPADRRGPRRRALARRRAPAPGARGRSSGCRSDPLMTDRRGMIRHVFETLLRRTARAGELSPRLRGHRRGAGRRSQPRHRAVRRAGRGAKGCGSPTSPRPTSTPTSSPAPASWPRRTGARLCSRAKAARMALRATRARPAPMLLRDGDIFRVGPIDVRGDAHAGSHAGASDVSRHRHRRGRRADGRAHRRFPLRRRRRAPRPARAGGRHGRGPMDAGARQLFRSLQRFRALPDHLQIWPGTAPAQRAARRSAPCRSPRSATSAGQLGVRRRRTRTSSCAPCSPDSPSRRRYFAEMKRINRDGPARARRPPPPAAAAGRAARALAAGRRLVVDTRPAAEFRGGARAGHDQHPARPRFTTWAGWLLPYDRDLI